METLQEQQTTKRIIQRALRFQISMAIRYRILGEKIWREGRVENISMTGLLFSGTDVIESGTSIDIRLVLPGRRLGSLGGTIVSKGKVTRSLAARDTVRRALVAAALINPRLLRLREPIEQQ